MDVVVDRKFLANRHYFPGFLDKTLILIKIRGRQNFNAEEKRILL
jgi:hypothetical protein